MPVIGLMNPFNLKFMLFVILANMLVIRGTIIVNDGACSENSPLYCLPRFYWMASL